VSAPASLQSAPAAVSTRPPPVSEPSYRRAGTATCRDFR
jgi:hypothetical protein